MSQPPEADDFRRQAEELLKPDWRGEPREVRDQHDLAGYMTIPVEKLILKLSLQTAVNSRFAMLVITMTLLTTAIRQIFALYNRQALPKLIMRRRNLLSPFLYWWLLKVQTLLARDWHLCDQLTKPGFTEPEHFILAMRDFLQDAIGFPEAPRGDPLLTAVTVYKLGAAEFCGCDALEESSERRTIVIPN